MLRFPTDEARIHLAKRRAGQAQQLVSPEQAGVLGCFVSGNSAKNMPGSSGCA
jgi:hypothetical protein